ncbi:MAG TPA: hypothetical protein VM529_25620 [Gemmata sp.]|jgi:hypothetical protein|nr:hypothetical protein [Gemmata sp.]
MSEAPRSEFVFFYPTWILVDKADMAVFGMPGGIVVLDNPAFSRISLQFTDEHMAELFLEPLPHKRWDILSVPDSATLRQYFVYLADLQGVTHVGVDCPAFESSDPKRFVNIRTAIKDLVP